MAEKASIVLTAEDQTRAAFSSVQRNLQDMQRAVSQIRNVGAAVFANEIAQGLGDAARAIVSARVEFEKLGNTLGQAVGTARIGQELSFLRETTQRLGLEFNSTAQSYAKFAAASRGTALEGQQTRDIFIGISQAAAALGLSSEETAGALTAVQQIISKGKVSAEELRGQLGERLPGAFQIAARSIGVTTQQLDGLLQAGSLLADDFLPKFGRQLQTEFADAASRASTSTQASLNRLESSWNDLKRTLATGPVGEATATGLTNLAANIQAISDRLRDGSREARGFFDWLGLIAREAPIGLAGIAFARRGDELSAAGRQSAAIELAYSQFASDAAREFPARPTASSVRAVDNPLMAAQATADREALRKLQTQFRTPDQVQRDQIAELRRLGALTGEDVSAQIAEIKRRAAGNDGEQAVRAAKAYVEALNDQVRALQEVSEIEKVVAELRAGGRLAGATRDQVDAALQSAGKLDEAKRLADEAERALARQRQYQEREDAQGAANEAQVKQLQDLANRYRDLADPARQYREQLAEIKRLVDEGALDPGDAERARAVIDRRLEELAGMHREVKQADDSVRELGLTFESAFERAAIEGENLRGVLKGLAQDALRFGLRKTVTEPGAKFLSGLLGQLLGGGGAGRLANDLAGYNALPFADGGVMTGRGPVPLRRYAAGGIARTPQLAMFGEGSMPEAYVPLPDGRSIPVTMTGGGISVKNEITVGGDMGRAQLARLGLEVQASTIRAIREAQARGAA